MAPNVSVPMNFGIRLLDSPTHSTLELKASQGAVIPASSVILSFNSPVIDHMTTTLHLTSVDMEEFSEDAVRYFVDAAYSGESPPISRVLFRDINKLANVFEMSWLATRCVEQFADIAAAIKEPSYEDFLFLFEEAAHVITKLKSRAMVEIAFTKIQSLNGQQDFISRYLENISSLSSRQLDLIIELAGTKVEFVVKPLSEQLAASLSRGETVVPANCKYLLENSELYLCHQRNIKMFEQLFDVLENTTKESFTETKWTLQLIRKSVVKREIQSKSLAGSSTFTDVLGDFNVILNLFHTLDCSMTFDEVVDWLGKSEKVTNLLMFFEGLWTWMWANKEVKIECTKQLLDIFCRIKERRMWDSIYKGWIVNFIKSNNVNAESFFQNIGGNETLCSPDRIDAKKWVLRGQEFQEHYSHSICSIFSKETKMMYHYKHPAVKNCSNQGECGFILKTVPAKDGAKMILCTDPSDYSETIHYHDEVQAKALHLLVLSTSLNKINPMSWFGKPEIRNSQVEWDTFIDLQSYKEDCLFYAIISLK